MQLNVDALRRSERAAGEASEAAPQRPDETMQLKVDALRRRLPGRLRPADRHERDKRDERDQRQETGEPDELRDPHQPRERQEADEPQPQPHETMQLRVFRQKSAPDRKTVPDRKTDAARKPDAAQEPGRRADRRKARRSAAQPGPLARRTAPLLAVIAPYARKLKPVYPRRGRTGWRRWMPSWRQWIGLAFSGIGLTTLFLVVAYAATDIPENLNSYATQQDNVYFWSDGTPMARTGWVQRQAMPLKDIPQDVRWAVLAAENESFYSDPGISFKGITRALWRTVGKGDTEGGSTITQQYVKNVYLTQNQTVSRKFTEAMIALKLDNKMSKDKILEGYLNTSWFGRGTYGIQRASQAYYGKDVGQLNASEAAFLASLLKGAGLYDPTLGPTNHARAVKRWKWTLDRMVKIGKLSKDERAKYTTFPEPLKRNPLSDTGQQSDYLVELASQYAKDSAHLSDKDFDLGGYQIYTTFDRKREAQLTDVVTKARKKARESDPKTAKTAHYGAASVATDGRVVAVYGGPDHRKQGFNESNAATVPAGSAFQPFVYAAGLEHGVIKQRDAPRQQISPESVYNGDDGVPVSTPEGPYWDRSGRKVAAHNDDKKSYGPITLRKALAQSVNTPFMQLGMDTGLDKVKDTAVASGLLSSTMGPQVPALALGNARPSAIRMASGYSTFAAAGVHTEPYSVLRITRNGATVPVDRPLSGQAVGTRTAQQVDDALADAFRTAHPTAAPASARITGKAGTTEDDTAAWYVGTASKVTTAVVVYRMDLAKSLAPLPLKGIGTTAAGSVPYTIWEGAMTPLG
ncbi:transglycosylase domain-containing protein [Streptomyces sp. NPDC056160]|uniref:transglycosylase domain-containing protein n=1 Tax=Streptomyces sp. NPDC056160 TaxID=3345731 RepID=UPI0035DAB7DF